MLIFYDLLQSVQCSCFVRSGHFRLPNGSAAFPHVSRPCSTGAPILPWTGLQGIGAASESLFLLPLASFDLADKASTTEIVQFIARVLVMGLAG